jgi:NAD(P)-dependent dehydrogenase (short-subunit alcohol dehydrogenase family)
VRLMLELSLKDYTVIITGAAKGIGASCAELFCTAGARLILVDISAEELLGVQQRLDPQKTSVLTVVGDTSDPQTAEDAVGVAVNRWGRLDCLVNNAAINIRDTALNLQMENWKRIMAVNLKGYFLFARAAGREMIRRNRGSIVNISSELSVVGSKTGQLAYSTAKGGINQLTRTLAAEWAEHGIRVNAVASGLTKTPLVKHRLQDPAYRQACVQGVPLQRLGQSQDVAHAVAFLSSSWADFFTGQVLIVNGGYTALR